VKGREHDELSSQFNYGIAYLYVLREIENKCIRASLASDYNAWLKAIKAFHRELKRRMDDDERKEAAQLIQECDAASSNGVGHLAKIDVGKIEHTLETAECYLKDIMTKRNMDLPAKEDPGKAILDR